MERKKQHYQDGFQYELLVRHFTAASKTNFGAELQNLLDIETGEARRISGQPTLPKWRDIIRKKLMSVAMKLVRRKKLSPEDRENLLKLIECIETAPTAIELNEVARALWPIASKAIARQS